MTEKIQKAIDKIDQEAEKMGSATVRLLCSHIIDHCLINLGTVAGMAFEERNNEE